MRSSWAVLAFLLILFAVSACDLLPDSGETAAVPEPTATASGVLATSVAPTVPDITFPITPTQATDLLRLWIPPMVAARTETGSVTLSDQLLAYDAENTDVAIVVEQKRVRGAGGMLSYFRTGRDIAPSILPDLVAVPTDVLPAMAGESLVFQLDDYVDEAALDALFPPALLLGRPDAALLGYPFALEYLPHLAYNNNVLTGTLPLTWQRLVENESNSYVFAADGLDGSLLALQFYLDAGGEVEDESGQPVLQTEPLITALQFIESAEDAGLFTAESATINSTDQAWQSFLSGAGNIVQTSADHFLGQTVAGLPIAYTVIPGIDSPLTPLVGGWAWAVTTADPAKQEQAIALIQHLTDPANLAAWSSDSDILPARRDALNAWPDQTLYIDFARLELERAEPLTVSSTSKLMTVLSDAVFQIVAEGSTAQQAAIDAVNAMNS